jgi:hypothetical protein
MAQKFQVGQTVLPAHPRGANPGTYVIVQVLPETSHERQYRIKALSSASSARHRSRRWKQSQASREAPTPAKGCAMPVDLPPQPSDREMAPRGLFARILNWTAVVVGIGLCWWAAAFLL